MRTTAPRKRHSLIISLFFISLFAMNSYAQQQPGLVEGCKNEKSRCLYADCHDHVCNEWVIILRLPNGQEWGRITEKTQAAALARLKSDVAFEHRYARFMGKEFDSEHYGQPLGPICKEECNLNRSTAENSALEGGALSLFLDWERKLETATRKFIKFSDLNNGGASYDPLRVRNPYAGVGSQLREYFRTIADSRRKFVQLRKRLNDITTMYGATSTQLDDLKDDIKISREATDRAYNALSSKEKSLVENGAEQGGSPELNSALPVLLNSTRGRLHDFVSRVLDADNKTLKAWAQDPDSSDLDFSGFLPNQKKHLKGFIGDVSTYKESLDTAYSFFSRGERGYDYLKQHRSNMPFEDADAFYRTTITNPGSSTAFFSVGSPPDPNEIFNTMNYSQYVAAMLARAGAASNIFEVMWIDGGYSKTEMEQVLQYGIQSARYIYEGAPTKYTKPEIVRARDEIIAAFNEKLERINRADNTVSNPEPSAQPERGTEPAPERVMNSKVKRSSQGFKTLPLSDARAPEPALSTKAQAFIESGNRLASERQWQDAIEAYKQALAVSPKSAEIYNDIGDAYMNSGRWQDAIAAYKEAIRAEPRNADGYVALGTAFNDMRQHGDAFPPLVKAIQLDPRNPEAYFGIGDAYFQLENYAKAVNFFRTAVRLDPEFEDAIYNLGLTYVALENKTAAVQQYNKLKDLDAELAADLKQEIDKTDRWILEKEVRSFKRQLKSKHTK